MATEDDDAVVESPWCVVCRRSSAVKWRKHVFSRSHQLAAAQFLSTQAAQLRALSDTATWWRCEFCAGSGATADAPAHFGGERHRRQVERFCREHRCDADRQTRPQLWLDAARRRELEAALSEREAGGKAEEQEQQQGQVEVEANDNLEAFLTSAVTRLQEVQAARKTAVEIPVEVLTGEQQQEKLWGPQLTVADGVKRLQTVTSSDGVVQNPLGRHEGRRVWGGGIVKIRKAKWVSWTIDQLVKEEQAGQPQMQQTEADGAAFAHRVTELARGEGLSSIASVYWGANVGNVHTAAIPPWMVQSEEEYKKCNRREQITPPEPNAGKQTHEGTKKRRDIFTELEKKSDYGPDWLPNFGGVWQEGPRSKTKQAFRSATKVLHTPAPPRRTEASASRAQMQAAVQHTPSTVPQLPLPSQASPPPPPPLPATTQPGAADVHSKGQVEKSRFEQVLRAPALPQSAPLTNRDKKAVNSLDEKKQQLLAQKERLRTKMAARRRK